MTFQKSQSSHLEELKKIKETKSQGHESVQTTPNKCNLSTNINKAGQSVFYDCMGASSPDSEKQDDMKPEKSDTEDEGMNILITAELKLIILF